MKWWVWHIEGSEQQAVIKWNVSCGQMGKCWECRRNHVVDVRVATGVIWDSVDWILKKEESLWIFQEYFKKNWKLSEMFEWKGYHIQPFGLFRYLACPSLVSLLWSLGWPDLWKTALITSIVVRRYSSLGIWPKLEFTIEGETWLKWNVPTLFYSRLHQYSVMLYLHITLILLSSAENFRVLF